MLIDRSANRTYLVRYSVESIEPPRCSYTYSTLVSPVERIRFDAVRCFTMVLAGAGVSCLGVSFSIIEAICWTIPRNLDHLCNCIFVYCSRSCVTLTLSRCCIALPEVTGTLISVPISRNSNGPTHPDHSAHRWNAFFVDQ